MACSVLCVFRSCCAIERLLRVFLALSFCCCHPRFRHSGPCPPPPSRGLVIGKPAPCLQVVDKVLTLAGLMYETNAQTVESVLLYGPRGVGKSGLVGHVASLLRFALVKVNFPRSFESYFGRRRTRGDIHSPRGESPLVPNTAATLRAKKKKKKKGRISSPDDLFVSWEFGPEVPFLLQVITPQSLLGLSEEGKRDHLIETFHDATK